MKNSDSKARRLISSLVALLLAISGTVLNVEAQNFIKDEGPTPSAYRQPELAPITTPANTPGIAKPSAKVQSDASFVKDEANKIIGSSDGKSHMLKGQVTYCVPSGTPIKLKLSTVPTTGLRLMDRDMDGKLHPAQLGQVITAKTSEDIYVDDNKVIPEGTVFHGKVTHLIAPRRVGRHGSLVLTFDHFVTPDGRKFAFKVEANNTRKSTMKTKAKGLGIIAAHAAGGAIVGALIAYQLFGLEQTLAMEGYNIAGGAAAGALMGTAVALLRRGNQAVLEPGDELNMEIDTDLLIPAATKPTLKPPPPNLPGLSVEVLKSKVVKDGLDGHLIRLDTVIRNSSNKKLYSMDAFLEDDNGHRFPMVADTGVDTSELLFHVEPHSEDHLTMCFGLEFPKLKRKLVWLDHHSRQVLFEQKLP